MRFFTTAIAASALAFVSAFPTPEDTPTIDDGSTDLNATFSNFGVFNLWALIREGPYAQNASFAVSKGGLTINGPTLKTCEKGPTNLVQFWIDEKEDLYLNTELPPTKVFTDRSGMGAGVIRIATGVNYGYPRSSEQHPFRVSKDYELFFGTGPSRTGFQICTGDSGKNFSIWMQGNPHPGGYAECYPFTAQVIKAPVYNKCEYDV